MITDKRMNRIERHLERANKLLDLMENKESTIEEKQESLHSIMKGFNEDIEEREKNLTETKERLKRVKKNREKREFAKKRILSINGIPV